MSICYLKPRWAARDLRLKARAVSDPSGPASPGGDAVRLELAAGEDGDANGFSPMTESGVVASGKLAAWAAKTDSTGFLEATGLCCGLSVPDPSSILESVSLAGALPWLLLSPRGMATCDIEQNDL